MKQSTIKHVLVCKMHLHTNTAASVNVKYVKRVKSSPSHKAHSVALIPVSLALSQTPAYTARDHGYGVSVSHGVPVYSPAFAGTHCAYPQRDGQAELTWVAGYIPRRLTHRQTVTHPSTKRARRRVTSLITSNVLTTTPRHHKC